MSVEHNKQNVNKHASKTGRLWRNRTRKIVSADNHVLKKRQPLNFIRKGKKDIYVTNKTNFKAQLKKCEKFFDAGESEIFIHGLGAAINRACVLALRLKEIHHGRVDFDIKTSTIELIDDLEPQNDDVDYETNVRYNSAIHIRVFQKITIGSLQGVQ